MTGFVVQQSVMMRVDEHVTLRVLTFTPSSPTPGMPIVIVSGMTTVVESFTAVLEELRRDFPVHYIETREKRSSQCRGDVRFDMETMGRDVAAVVHGLGLEDRHYALMGYSIGATAVCDGYRHLSHKPRCVILMQPTPVFHYPWWSLVLIRWLGAQLYPVVKPLAKWYLGTLRINTKEDAEMARLSFLALDSADAPKLKQTVLSVADYQVWHRLDAIDCETLVVAASKDSLHVHDEITRMVTGIRNCRLVDLETNTRTHGTEMAAVVRDFVGRA